MSVFCVSLNIKKYFTIVAMYHGVVVIAGAAEHDECDEAVRVVEAVGHADGDLDPVVGRLEPGVDRKSVV